MNASPIIHYGPVYQKRGPFGQSLAACRPGVQASTLTTDKRWVTCEACKDTSAFRWSAQFSCSPVNHPEQKR